MDKIKDLTERILKIRKDRDWKQFHTPKDMAMSLVLEASEVLEHFQWKTRDDVQKYIKDNKEAIGDELSDVFYWVLLLSHDLGIDIYKASLSKLEKSIKKYPVEKSKGRAEKYDKL